ncbi:Uncharacterised protein [Sporosarcina pasteurii]|uniref:Uncharacterized protein n=1 Tax=Sporosarcina pasteurii TaxID=1474 RepID=A0A380C1H7_SPOPA|nr:Uncharacterised protein [Sporosarcina pasteurii]
MNNENEILVISRGQDSTTCLSLELVLVENVSRKKGAEVE